MSGVVQYRELEHQQTRRDATKNDDERRKRVSHTQR